MTTRLLLLAAGLAVAAGCSSAKPVSEFTHAQQIAQDAGYSQYNERNWHSAARSFQRAADLANALDDFPAEAAARHNQARALQHTGKLDDAIAAYQRALDINRRLNRAADQSLNLAGTAQCRAAQDKLDEAIDTAKQAISLAADAKPTIQNDLAGFLIRRNQPGDLTDARKLLDTADTKSAVTQLNLGRLALATGKPADAKPRLTQALDTFRAEQNIFGIAYAHDALATCCAALGDTATAEFHRQEARNKFSYLKIVPADDRNTTGTSAR